MTIDPGAVGRRPAPRSRRGQTLGHIRDLAGKPLQIGGSTVCMAMARAAMAMALTPFSGATPAGRATPETRIDMR